MAHFGYLDQHNAKYAVAEREPADYHLQLPLPLNLDQVFCLEEERIVSDWVVQYGKRWLQIEREQKVLVNRGVTVTIREHRDNSLSLWLGQTELRWHELADRPRRPARTAKPGGQLGTAAADHLWPR
jgi:hypothetical protein